MLRHGPPRSPQLLDSDKALKPFAQTELPNPNPKLSPNTLKRLRVERKLYGARARPNPRQRQRHFLLGHCSSAFWILMQSTTTATSTSRGSSSSRRRPAAATASATATNTTCPKPVLLLGSLPTTTHLGSRRCASMMMSSRCAIIVANQHPAHRQGSTSWWVQAGRSSSSRFRVQSKISLRGVAGVGG